MSGVTRRGLILGAGATARSALAAVGELGITEVTVAARDPARAAGLLAAAARLGTTVTLTPFGAPVGIAPDLLISTVPASFSSGVTPVSSGRTL